MKGVLTQTGGSGKASGRNAGVVLTREINKCVAVWECEGCILKKETKHLKRHRAETAQVEGLECQPRSSVLPRRHGGDTAGFSIGE